MDPVLEATVIDLHSNARRYEHLGDDERARLLRCAADLVAEVGQDARLPVQRVVSVADRVTAILR